MPGFDGTGPGGMGPMTGGGRGFCALPYGRPMPGYAAGYGRPLWGRGGRGGGFGRGMGFGMGRGMGRGMRNPYGSSFAGYPYPMYPNRGFYNPYFYG